VNDARSGLPAVEARLVDALGSIRSRARSDTKVVLVPYPYLSNRDDDTLIYRRLGLVESDRYEAGAEVRRLGEAGDQAQRREVDAANRAAGTPFVTYVDDVKAHFAGHKPDPSASERNPARWLHEFDSYIPAEWYHCNTEGHGQLASLVSRGGA